MAKKAKKAATKKATKFELVTELLAADLDLSAAPGDKPVLFRCSSAACVVGITSGSINIVFSGSGGAKFPVGPSTIFWRVKGPSGTDFSITAEGGTLNKAIQGSISPDSAGSRILTVQ